MRKKRQTKQFDAEKLALLLRQKRGDHGLRAIAAQTGISPSTLSRVENGKQPDLEGFIALCNWLGADPSEFFVNRTGGDSDSVPVQIRLISSSRETLESAAEEMREYFGDAFQSQRVLPAREGWRIYATLLPESQEERENP